MKVTQELISLLFLVCNKLSQVQHKRIFSFVMSNRESLVIVAFNIHQCSGGWLTIEFDFTDI